MISARTALTASAAIIAVLIALAYSAKKAIEAGWL